ncbi:hypothetical protein AB0D71_27780 [Streptomyces avermitilis]|uniref:hypothetical protein n=1 Tax=Streptomyces avermitilis TaxID=33903 RepID=UPI0033C19DD0
MFAYELHQIRSAELIREAQNHRLVREALRLRRNARKAAAGEPGTDGRSTSHSDRPRRPRFARAA